MRVASVYTPDENGSVAFTGPAAEGFASVGTVFDMVYLWWFVDVGLQQGGADLQCARKCRPFECENFKGAYLPPLTMAHRLSGTTGLTECALGALAGTRDVAKTGTPQ